MKDQKESSEAVADEQRSDLFLVVPEGYLMYRNARLVQAQFAAGVGQNHQVVKGRLRFALDLVFLPNFLLENMLVTFDHKKLFQKGGLSRGGGEQELPKILILCF